MVNVTVPKKQSPTDRLRNAFSRMTLFLALGFGALTTLSLLEEPSRTLQPLLPSVAGVRAPASLTPTKLGNRVKPLMGTADVGCENGSRFNTPSEHLRLKGKVCGVDATSTAVRNTANGFAATVFHQGDSGFTTDYISLATGENKIVIEQTLESGQTQTREVTVVRE